MKKILTRYISAVLASTLILTGCSTNINTASENNQQINASSIDAKINKSEIFLEKTVNVTIDKASIYGDKVEVSSSFGQFTARTTDLSVKSETIVINQLSPQLITLSGDNTNAKTPLALSVVANPQRAQSILISPQTTAEALIFMDPNLATTDLNLADKIMNIIKSLPETKELAKIIEQRTQKEADFLSKDNAQQNQAMSKAVNTVVNRMADEFDKNQVSEPASRVDGVEINTKSQNQVTANLELKNYKKRMVSLYFNGEVNGKPSSIYNENLNSAFDFLDFDNISLGFKPFTKEVNVDIQKPIKTVEVIGLGLKDIKDFKEKWPSMPNSEKLRYGMPIAKSLMFDFVSPVISIVTGFNVNKVYDVGLIRILGSLPVLQIVDNFRNKEYGKAFKAILGGTIKALLVNNGALLREMLLKAGLNLTDAILKRLNAAVSIFNLARHSFELARALYAYSTTHITSYFKVENNNGKLIFSKKE